MQIGLSGPHHGAPSHHGVRVPGNWWRGWSGWQSPVIYETQRDPTPFYFLGGAVLLGALLLSSRR